MAETDHGPAEKPERRRVMLATVWIEPAHLRGIARYARKAGWVFDGCEPDHIDRLAAWKGDGIICQLHPKAKAFLNLVRSIHVPKVEMADYIADMHLPRVVPDYDACGRQVAEHFLGRGFRNFVVFYARPTPRSAIHAFLDRLAAAECEAPAFAWERRSVRRAGYGPMDRRRWLADKLAKLPKPLAVFADDHVLGVEVLDSCADAGLLVPEQISVLAVSPDNTMCEVAPVPLSSIAHDYEEQAYRAAALLDSLMDGQPAPTETIRVPPQKLWVRQSSDIAAIENAEVARAVMFIRQNVRHKGLGVPDVVEATILSRRSLDRAFHQHLGRSVAAEIRRLRMEEATELLRTTSWTALRIAEYCGYSDAKHLRRSLLRATGLLPKAYRRRHQGAPAQAARESPPSARGAAGQ